MKAGIKNEKQLVIRIDGKPIPVSGLQYPDPPYDVVTEKTNWENHTFQFEGIYQSEPRYRTPRKLKKAIKKDIQNLLKVRPKYWHRMIRIINP